MSARLSAFRARRSVQAWRLWAAATLVLSEVAYRLAKGSMLRALEMVRAPFTVSATQRRPAVSSTKAPPGSATMKLLW